MEHFIETFARHGYLAVFVLMLLESACIPIPSEVTMLLAGAVANAGLTIGSVPRLNFVAVALVGVAGNVVGSLVAYGVGRAVGRGPVERVGRYVGIRGHDIDRAERWWAKRGEATVFLSRLLPGVRTFISLPAGIEEMPVGRFLLFTTAGCVPWVFALTGVGYALGGNWHKIVGPFRYVTYAIAALVVAAFVLYLVRRRASDTPSETV